VAKRSFVSEHYQGRFKRHIFVRTPVELHSDLLHHIWQQCVVVVDEILWNMADAFVFYDLALLPCFLGANDCLWRIEIEEAH
jgi:hypothetical protein